MKHYFLGYDLLNRKEGDTTPTATYSTNEARTFIHLSMAEVTAKTLTEDTGEKHFVEESGFSNEWIVYKQE